MRLVEIGVTLGRIELRVGNPQALISVAGHVGYDVSSEHRGNQYAARSCRLLVALALHHDLNPLWITCNPDNRASRGACEIIGCKLMETIPVTVQSERLRIRSRWKCRYRIRARL
ncbi:MAG: GNAT family N-acetyltransferase [Candidatus Latescibacteria bacterium]|nr:GNAT family N-acetyltransferase [Candidatus Latescibacterota bacterium]